MILDDSTPAPKHLTKRALAELRGEDSEHLPFDKNVCGARFLRHQSLTSGTVKRSLALGLYPRCVNCCASIDAVLERTVRR